MKRQWAALALTLCSAVHAQVTTPLPSVPEHAWARHEMGEVRYLIPSTDLPILLAAAGATLGAVQSARLYFYDSCDGSLRRSGIYLSARIPSEGGPSTLWVRLRPTDSSIFDSHWLRPDGGLSCIWQWVGPSMTPSCTLERNASASNIMGAETGEVSFADLFGEEQRSFITLYAPQLIPWESLVSAGPVHSYRWEVARDFTTGPLAMELWRLGSLEEVLTVSTRARLEDLPAVRTRMLQWLQSAGLRPVEDDFTRVHLVLQQQLTQEISCMMGQPWQTYP